MIYYVGLLGLIFGSFFNVVGYRYLWDDFWRQSRSYCPFCHQTLSFIELIPIFSYLFQKGRCRTCHQLIHWSYPLIELMTAMSWMLCFKFSSSWAEFLLLTAFFSILIILTAIDCKHFLLPNEWLFILGFWLMFQQLFYQQSLFLGVIRASILFLVAICVYRLMEHKIGAGDIKMLCVLAIGFTFQELIWILFISSAVALIMIGGLLIRKKLEWKSQIPFGPFLAIGTMVVTLFMR
ncbi:prepilin peptidase [Allofustis seminis]|uniref:prepilin peptidase n=1 Tax=Allofustis seminis TaxID=166939 RepID=UPI0003647389|nr:A24 family peptidase [Allofustis seminis]